MAGSTVVLDVDGTLVDSSYHHTLCWARALESVGITVPLWRIHRAIGMGGDKLVGYVAGDEVEKSHGDAVRAQWEQEYDAVIGEVRPLPGARELLAALHGRDVDVALASSSIPKHADHAFELLDAESMADTATTAEDAEESKPDPELVEVALDRLSADAACVIGDSVWDVKAAGRAGVPAYGVLTGGTSEAELLAAGAVRVYRDASDLLDQLGEWLP
ncbi:MAG TPA: HAD family hydrolase [Nocardioides sp.]|uniref:HAD family hydrolase n=1 Tax=uncultured Nocardioides sp. TaxID=198441 RepID=UPI002607A00D|nr:HAD family hydrolase [uncultured Nocardioides sp.]HRD62189.1 HAD family hydrolase [Nocardioides sp.]HRI94583.1 HAD family hydrolase [Nocardioides sp.]HRK44921.1 HAD family hydrolase [Nocardioides sp.]